MGVVAGRREAASDEVGRTLQDRVTRAAPLSPGRKRARRQAIRRQNAAKVDPIDVVDFLVTAAYARELADWQDQWVYIL